ncbi:MAG: ATP-binding protein [Acidimicrobiaceae bacterium]|nr:ATP-binding protein [Acidimicrobiaceae bacterium]
MTGPEPSRQTRRLTSPSYHPAEEPRARSRARHRAERDLLSRACREENRSRKAEYDRERAERRAASYLPRGGETGPAALRSYRRFAVKPHRATSAVLSHAYPFLAEGGLGGQGMLIGEDLFSGGSFCFDPFVLYRNGVITNPNTLLAGVIGTGKSSLAKSIIGRSIAFGRRAYVPGDPKGEWTPLAEAVGGQAIALGPGLTNRLNPLDEGTRPSDLDQDRWDQQVKQRRRDLLGSLTETVLGRPIQPTEHTALDTALEHAVASTETPTLPDVVGYLLDPVTGSESLTQLKDDGRQVAHALRRLVQGDLAGLFDGPSTVRFDPSLPMVSLDLSRVGASDELLALVMTCASSWMEAALLDPDAGQRWVVYDEAWRIMREPSLIRRMQSQWKLSRAYGIANLMIMHRLSDLDAIGDASSQSRALAAGLLADCSTRVIYRQESDQLAATGASLGLTRTERELLPDLGVGEGLWRIGKRGFVVQHQLTPAELELFDTTARMIGR